MTTETLAVARDAAASVGLDERAPDVAAILDRILARGLTVADLHGLANYGIDAAAIIADGFTAEDVRTAARHGAPAAFQAALLGGLDAQRGGAWGVAR